ncbi:sensor histidine kinase [Kitasatospora phosalacinea]|uniref:histidine kinase n=1 Tax=Kitasatospora phosalacinea TaxID=2065 RepID=A0A9W6UM88_9ACTN|nr:sensor histidine kinase [Kitasatospora phosalacinea]GLW52932.1 histidine kinase [Kitasatospora phosalacinea]
MENEAKRPSLYGPQLWRQVRNALLNFPIGVAGFVVAAVLLTTGLGLAVTLVGLPLLAFGLGCCRWFGRVARARARAELGSRVTEPEPLRPVRAGLAGRVVAALGDGLNWRSALYCVALLVWGVLSFVLTLVLLVVGWPVLPWAMASISWVSRLLVESLLWPGALAERVRELEDDRGVVVDTAAADLRRIERDLHDGAQARLVALAMDLGLAKEKLTEDPVAAQKMVDAAHGEVKLALQELRDLARGIHPAVLTDRGLDAALSSVAARCTLPGGVRVHVELGGERPDSAVEGIAYFTVSELLTNASKHSGARTATVEVWRQENRLMLTVRDDGRGGALVHPGGGLAGLAERAESVDGVFVVDSPEQGPTSVTVELPWHTRAGHKS